MWVDQPKPTETHFSFPILLPHSTAGPDDKRKRM
jgi:hypothetical protein